MSQIIIMDTNLEETIGGVSQDSPMLGRGIFHVLRVGLPFIDNLFRMWKSLVCHPI
jgi:hypothetical protein